MVINEMLHDDCIAFLAESRLARLACVHDGQPYIVPLYFAYDDGRIYAFSTIGRKIDWLRDNPRVCLEVDDIHSAEEWRCVVVSGDFKELTDIPELRGAREHAYRALQSHASWWEPATVRIKSDHETRPQDPIYFRISIHEITGRQATPDLLPGARVERTA